MMRLMYGVWPMSDDADIRQQLKSQGEAIQQVQESLASLHELFANEQTELSALVRLVNERIDTLLRAVEGLSEGGFVADVSVDGLDALMDKVNALLQKLSDSGMAYDKALIPGGSPTAPRAEGVPRPVAAQRSDMRFPSCVSRLEDRLTVLEDPKSHKPSGIWRDVVIDFVAAAERSRSHGVDTLHQLLYRFRCTAEGKGNLAPRMTQMENAFASLRTRYDDHGTA